MRFWILFIMFLLIGAFFIISENRLALKNPENASKFLNLYFSWFSQIFDNSKNLIGYVVKLEWLPDNKTG